MIKTFDIIFANNVNELLNIKRSVRICGVYCIRNKLNDKLYIGSTSNIRKRFRHHIKKLLSNRHNKKLQHAFNKYLVENFDFIVLEQCNNITVLKDREQHWINFYNSAKNGYNVNPNTHERMYKTLPAEQIRQLRIRFSGKNNPMYKRSIYDTWLHRYGKEEADKRHQIWVQHCREREDLKGLNNPSTKDEIKKKISLAKKGHRHTEETKLKISKTKKGTKLSDETKRQMSLTRRGENNSASKLSNEQRRIIIKRLDNGESPGKIKIDYNVTRQCIYNIKHQREVYVN